MADAELDPLAERIQRLVAHPGEVRDLVGSIAGPIMRALEWQPSLQTRATKHLLERIELEEVDASILGIDDLQTCLRRATTELESNITSVERACVVHGRAPFAYVTWLWRLYQVLYRAARACAAPSPAALREYRSDVDALDILPPLEARAGEGAVAQLLAIDPLIEAARAEQDFLGRRRRLLEAAREMLLDASAAVELDAEHVAARKSYLAQEIARVGRLQAAGVSPDVSLIHQMRQALTRGESQRVHALLSTLDDFAVAAGNRELCDITRPALDRLWQGNNRFSEAERAASLARSAAETFGPSTAQAIEQGFCRARAELRALEREGAEESARRLEAMQHHLQDIDTHDVLNAALAVDGCFDVGSVLTPLRVEQQERRARAVRHPTSEQLLLPARVVEDLPDAVIRDPRAVLLDLAAGGLLARRYVAEEVRRKTQNVLASEARIYVLDGSGSMVGPRACMRDAVLVAELATLVARFNDARRTLNPVLYYLYFTKEVGEMCAVRNEAEALAAISEALSTVRTGGTDIEKALIASFEHIHAAQNQDANLARAQIVLVTDGEAAVDEQRVLAARQRVGRLPVGVSIIALGQENQALRTLAAHQRARGERVFYHFLSDQELRAILAGKGVGLPIHLPEALAPAQLGCELASVCDEVEQHRRKSDLHALEHVAHERAALEEMGLSLDGPSGEVSRARLEAMNRDGAALRRRFLRWFPLLEGAGAALAPGEVDRADLDLLILLLASVAEVVDSVAGEALPRQADAIEVFERLLLEAGVAPWRYAELVRRYPAELAPALRAVHASVGASL